MKLEISDVFIRNVPNNATVSDLAMASCPCGTGMCGFLLSTMFAGDCLALEVPRLSRSFLIRTLLRQFTELRLVVSVQQIHVHRVGTSSGKVSGGLHSNCHTERRHALYITLAL